MRRIIGELKKAKQAAAASKRKRNSNKARNPPGDWDAVSASTSAAAESEVDDVQVRGRLLNGGRVEMEGTFDDEDDFEDLPA